MKAFSLEPSMLTMRGVFYPTGHLFLMFPTPADAADAVKTLLADGYNGDSFTEVPAEAILGPIARTVSAADAPLPSAGTEARTVRRFAELAAQGHCALMIHAPSAEETGHIMQVLAKSRISYGQKYRHLVIEDLA
ncbi:MAG: hypothetical protein KIS62_12635 [Ramlibacter sp.]|nr:hypothetical protein [Ramlibacter sp.]